jgi:hypothetical protein
VTVLYCRKPEETFRGLPRRRVVAAFLCRTTLSLVRALADGARWDWSDKRQIVIRALTWLLAIAVPAFRVELTTTAEGTHLI